MTPQGHESEKRRSILFREVRFPGWIKVPITVLDIILIPVEILLVVLLTVFFIQDCTRMFGN